MSHSSPPPSTALQPQRGRTHIVTGANSGLGLATTRALVHAGAHVVMAVRSVERGEAARRQLEAERPSGTLEVQALDLARQQSVRDFAARLHAHDVDVLINNAGAGANTLTLGEGGIESQFAANHLGPFLLTALLLERLARSARSPRVVTVTSGFIRRARDVDTDALAGPRPYFGGVAYVRSKLANALFGFELDRRLRAAGSPVRSVVVHPGFAATPMHEQAQGVTRLAVRVLGALFALTPEAGAAAQVHAATADEVEGGQFYGPTKSGLARLESPGKAALDPLLARRVWDVSERLTGLTRAG